MNDESEIVNLDDCPMKPALLVGAPIAFFLTLFPLGFPLVAIGGFAATTSFIFKFKVRIELKYGMKIAILACLIGFGASTLLYDLLWALFDYRIGFETYIEFLQQMAESYPPSSGDPLRESIELLKEQSFGFGVVIQQLLTIFVASGIGGAVGGALATFIFRKGALAQ